MLVKKSIALSARVRRTKKNAKPTPDHKIDFSDLPELTEEQQDAIDLRIARKVLKEVQKHGTIPWEEVKRRRDQAQAKKRKKRGTARR